MDDVLDFSNEFSTENSFSFAEDSSAYQGPTLSELASHKTYVYDNPAVALSHTALFDPGQTQYHMMPPALGGSSTGSYDMSGRDRSLYTWQDTLRCKIIFACVFLVAFVGVGIGMGVWLGTKPMTDESSLAGAASTFSPVVTTPLVYVPETGPDFQGQVRFLSAVFTYDLANPNSSSFAQTQKQYETVFDTIYQNSYIKDVYNYTRVTGFASGSLIVRHVVYLIRLAPAMATSTIEPGKSTPSAPSPSHTALLQVIKNNASALKEAFVQGVQEVKTKNITLPVASIEVDLQQIVFIVVNASVDETATANTVALTTSTATSTAAATTTTTSTSTTTLSSTSTKAVGTTQAETTITLPTTATSSQPSTIISSDPITTTTTRSSTTTAPDTTSITQQDTTTTAKANITTNITTQFSTTYQPILTSQENTTTTTPPATTTALQFNTTTTQPTTVLPTTATTTLTTSTNTQLNTTATPIASTHDPTTSTQLATIPQVTTNQSTTNATTNAPTHDPTTPTTSTQLTTIPQVTTNQSTTNATTIAPTHDPTTSTQVTTNPQSTTNQSTTNATPIAPTHDPTTSTQQTTIPQVTTNESTTNAFTIAPTHDPAPSSQLTTNPQSTTNQSTTNATPSAPTHDPTTSTQLTTIPQVTTNQSTTNVTTIARTHDPAPSSQLTTNPQSTTNQSTTNATSIAPTHDPTTSTQLRTIPQVTTNQSTTNATTIARTHDPAPSSQLTTNPQSTTNQSTTNATSIAPTHDPTTSTQLTTIPQVTTNQSTTNATTIARTHDPAPSSQLTTNPQSTTNQSTTNATSIAPTHDPTTSTQLTTIPQVTTNQSTTNATTIAPTHDPTTGTQLTTNPQSTTDQSTTNAATETPKTTLQPDTTTPVTNTAANTPSVTSATTIQLPNQTVTSASLPNTTGGADAMVNSTEASASSASTAPAAITTTVGTHDVTTHSQPTQATSPAIVPTTTVAQSTTVNDNGEEIPQGVTFNLNVTLDADFLESDYNIQSQRIQDILQQVRNALQNYPTFLEIDVLNVSPGSVCLQFWVRVTANATLNDVYTLTSGLQNTSVNLSGDVYSITTVYIVSHGECVWMNCGDGVCAQNENGSVCLCPRGFGGEMCMREEACPSNILYTVWPELAKGPCSQSVLETLRATNLGEACYHYVNTLKCAALILRVNKVDCSPQQLQQLMIFAEWAPFYNLSIKTGISLCNISRADLIFSVSLESTALCNVPDAIIYVGDYWCVGFNSTQNDKLMDGIPPNICTDAVTEMMCVAEKLEDIGLNCSVDHLASALSASWLVNEINTPFSLHYRQCRDYVTVATMTGGRCFNWANPANKLCVEDLLPFIQPEYTYGYVSSTTACHALNRGVECFSRESTCSWQETREAITEAFSLLLTYKQFLNIELLPADSTNFVNVYQAFTCPATVALKQCPESWTEVWTGVEEACFSSITAAINASTLEASCFHYVNTLKCSVYVLKARGYNCSTEALHQLAASDQQLLIQLSYNIHDNLSVCLISGPSLQFAENIDNTSMCQLSEALLYVAEYLCLEEASAAFNSTADVLDPMFGVPPNPCTLALRTTACIVDRLSDLGLACSVDEVGVALYISPLLRSSTSQLTQDFLKCGDYQTRGGSPCFSGQGPCLKYLAVFSSPHLATESEVCTSIWTAGQCLVPTTQCSMEDTHRAIITSLAVEYSYQFIIHRPRTTGLNYDNVRLAFQCSESLIPYLQECPDFNDVLSAVSDTCINSLQAAKYSFDQCQHYASFVKCVSFVMFTRKYNCSEEHIRQEAMGNYWLFTNSSASWPESSSTQWSTGSPQWSDWPYFGYSSGFGYSEGPGPEHSPYYSSSSTYSSSSRSSSGPHFSSDSSLYSSTEQSASGLTYSLSKSSSSLGMPDSELASSSHDPAAYSGTQYHSTSSSASPPSSSSILLQPTPLSHGDPVSTLDPSDPNVFGFHRSSLYSDYSDGWTTYSDRDSSSSGYYDGSLYQSLAYVCKDYTLSSQVDMYKTYPCYNPDAYNYILHYYCNDDLDMGTSTRNADGSYYNTQSSSSTSQWDWQPWITGNPHPPSTTADPIFSDAWNTFSSSESTWHSSSSSSFWDRPSSSSRSWQESSTDEPSWHSSSSSSYWYHPSSSSSSLLGSSSGPSLGDSSLPAWLTTQAFGQTSDTNTYWTTAVPNTTLGNPCTPLARRLQCVERHTSTLGLSCPTGVLGQTLRKFQLDVPVQEYIQCQQYGIQVNEDRCLHLSSASACNSELAFFSTASSNVSDVCGTFRRGVACLASKTTWCTEPEVEKAWRRYLDYVVTNVVLLTNVTFNVETLTLALACQTETSSGTLPACPGWDETWRRVQQPCLVSLDSARYSYTDQCPHYAAFLKCASFAMRVAGYNCSEDNIEDMTLSNYWLFYTMRSTTTESSWSSSMSSRDTDAATDDSARSSIPGYPGSFPLLDDWTFHPLANSSSRVAASTYSKTSDMTLYPEPSYSLPGDSGFTMSSSTRLLPSGNDDHFPASGSGGDSSDFSSDHMSRDYESSISEPWASSSDYGGDSDSSSSTLLPVKCKNQRLPALDDASTTSPCANPDAYSYILQYHCTDDQVYGYDVTPPSGWTGSLSSSSNYGSSSEFYDSSGRSSNGSSTWYPSYTSSHSSFSSRYGGSSDGSYFPGSSGEYGSSTGSTYQEFSRGHGISSPWYPSYNNADEPGSSSSLQPSSSGYYAGPGSFQYGFSHASNSYSGSSGQYSSFGSSSGVYYGESSSGSGYYPSSASWYGYTTPATLTPAPISKENACRKVTLKAECISSNLNQFGLMCPVDLVRVTLYKYSQSLLTQEVQLCQAVVNELRQDECFRALIANESSCLQKLHVSPNNESKICNFLDEAVTCSIESYPAVCRQGSTAATIVRWLEANESMPEVAASLGIFLSPSGRQRVLKCPVYTTKDGCPGFTEIIRVSAFGWNLLQKRSDQNVTRESQCRLYQSMLTSSMLATANYPNCTALDLHEILLANETLVLRTNNVSVSACSGLNASFNATLMEKESNLCQSRELLELLTGGNYPCGINLFQPAQVSDVCLRFDHALACYIDFASSLLPPGLRCSRESIVRGLVLHKQLLDQSYEACLS